MECQNPVHATGHSSDHMFQAEEYNDDEIILGECPNEGPKGWKVLSLTKVCNISYCLVQRKFFTRDRKCSKEKYLF